MIHSVSSEQLQHLQNEILEAIARGESLKNVADLLCLRAQSLAPTAICSILTVDAQGFLHPLAGPALPEQYSLQLDGIAIGPCAGSCGTAAYLGEPVIVEDIATDPLWAPFKSLALPYGLRACWSSPIKARDGRVVGTFAFYYPTPRGPAELERQIVEKCVHVCAIAIEHDEVQSRIHQLAYFDTLTGLPNRAQFQDRAAVMLASAPPGTTVNVLYIDLDDFKSVNDTLGHRIGDLLLEAAARRLESCTSGDAFVARLGGDEFAVVLSARNGRAGASTLADCIIGEFDNPFEIDEQKVTVGATIGIAHTQPGCMDLDELSRRADMALYSAKSEGRRTHRFFAPEMDTSAQLHRSVKQDLRAGIETGQFVLFYQPIVVLETDELVAFEALLRWQHPTRGLVSPDDFIPIAEEMGLIDRLGEWVLREACSAAARWGGDVRIAVNLSPLQLRQSRLLLQIREILNDTMLEPTRLELEITESALLADSAATRVTLGELRRLGIRISLDDFGTGYSSLRSLRAFPVDKIKIDRSFVTEIGRNSDSDAIIRAVIGLAKDLGIETAAEGIENQTQLRWLYAQGCTQGQGHYFSEPLREAQVGLLLATDPNTGAHGPRVGQRLT
jgi:diguanylate cyclase (GGDEF)-like protein